MDSPLVWEVPFSLSGWRPRLGDRCTAPAKPLTLEDIQMKLDRAADRRMVRDAAVACCLESSPPPLCTSRRVSRNVASRSNGHREARPEALGGLASFEGARDCQRSPRPPLRLRCPPSPSLRAMQALRRSRSARELQAEPTSQIRPAEGDSPSRQRQHFEASWGPVGTLMGLLLQGEAFIRSMFVG